MNNPNSVTVIVLMTKNVSFGTDIKDPSRLKEQLQSYITHLKKQEFRQEFQNCIRVIDAGIQCNAVVIQLTKDKRIGKKMSCLSMTFLFETPQDTGKFLEAVKKIRI